MEQGKATHQTNQKKAPEITTPQHEARLKQAAQVEQKKKESVVVATWYEVYNDPTNKKGGKIRKCERTEEGNVYRTLFGRVKTHKNELADLKAKGLEIKSVA